MTLSLLVVNPNSSEKVTTNLEKILVAPPGVDLTFYTAPSSAPKEIDGNHTSILSEHSVLPDLLAKDVASKYDGFLICCYSDHPLIYSFGKHTKKPILGIMQATLLYSLLNPSVNKLFILTSVDEWELILDNAITSFIGTTEFPAKKFQKTKALNVSVLNLSDPNEFAKIYNKVKKFLDEYANDSIDCVLLGCAGMAGLDSKLTEAFPGIQFIDSVKIGVELLTGLVRFNKQNIS